MRNSRDTGEQTNFLPPQGGPGWFDIISSTLRNMQDVKMMSAVVYLVVHYTKLA